MSAAAATIPKQAAAAESPLAAWLNEFHVGDCLDAMAQMPAESVDLIVTSPPYNLRNSTGGGMRGSGRSFWQRARLRDGYDGDTDDMPRAAYIGWQRECLTAMMRLLPETGALFYIHKRRVQRGVEEDPRLEILYDFPVRQTITWQRAGGINFNLGYFLPTTEVIYLIPKSERFRLASSDAAHPKAACSLGDVWSVPQQDKTNLHPAPFPVEIARRCIEATDARVILDPFAGSGTTAIAAEMLGRQWIGIEKALPYIEQSRRRLAAWRSMTPEDLERVRKSDRKRLTDRLRKLEAEKLRAKLLETDPPPLDWDFSEGKDCAPPPSRIPRPSRDVAAGPPGVALGRQ